MLSGVVMLTLVRTLPGSTQFTDKESAHPCIVVRATLVCRSRQLVFPRVQSRSPFGLRWFSSFLVLWMVWWSLCKTTSSQLSKGRTFHTWPVCDGWCCTTEQEHYITPAFILRDFLGSFQKCPLASLSPRQMTKIHSTVGRISSKC